jgi:hypothetical protein
MSELLANPKALIALACLGALVLGLNLTLFGLLRGSKQVQEEAAKWGKALRGGVDGGRQQEAQLDELHRAVAGLKSQTGGQDRPHDQKEST